MRRRALHLASVFLLLASLSAAEGAVPRPGEYPLGCHYLVVLLAQDHARACAIAEAVPSAISEFDLDLPAAAASRCRTVWSMRPPSAHSASLHAVTGSSF